MRTSRAYRSRFQPRFPMCSVTFAALPALGRQAFRVVLNRMRIKVVSGKSHLGACFPLRCFQRLSLPYIATRQCDWRHNRYTSGTSTPVLSY